MRAVDGSWLLGGRKKRNFEERRDCGGAERGVGGRGGHPANFGEVQRVKIGPWSLLEHGRLQAGKKFASVT